MSNRVIIELSYSKRVIVDVADLPKLMDILNGATVVDYGYVGNERVDYVTDEAFCLEFKDTGNRLYKTQEQFRAMEKAYGEQPQDEEDAA